MEVVLLVFVVGGILLLILYALLRLIKRELIIKKHFKKISKQILDGAMDDKLLENSKKSGGHLTPSGLATCFGNEATRNAIEEFIAKGLADDEEKENCIWLSGNYFAQVEVDQVEILAGHIVIRSKKIGAKLMLQPDEE